MPIEEIFLDEAVSRLAGAISARHHSISECRRFKSKVQADLGCVVRQKIASAICSGCKKKSARVKIGAAPERRSRTDRNYGSGTFPQHVLHDFLRAKTPSAEVCNVGEVVRVVNNSEAEYCAHGIALRCAGAGGGSIELSGLPQPSVDWSG